MQSAPKKEDLVAKLRTKGIETDLPPTLRSVADETIIDEAIGILQDLKRKTCGKDIVLLGEIWRVEKNYHAYTGDQAKKLCSSTGPISYGTPISESELRQQKEDIRAGKYTVRYGRIRDEAA